MKVAMKFAPSVGGYTDDFRLVGDVDPDQRIVDFLRGESHVFGFFPPEAAVMEMEGDRVVILRHPLGLRGSDWELVLY